MSRKTERIYPGRNSWKETACHIRKMGVEVAEIEISWMIG